MGIVNGLLSLYNSNQQREWEEEKIRMKQRLDQERAQQQRAEFDHYMPQVTASNPVIERGDMGQQEFYNERVLRENNIRRQMANNAALHPYMEAREASKFMKPQFQKNHYFQDQQGTLAYNPNDRETMRIGRGHKPNRISVETANGMHAMDKANMTQPEYLGASVPMKPPKTNEQMYDNEWFKITARSNRKILDEVGKDANIASTYDRTMNNIADVVEGTDTGAYQSYVAEFKQAVDQMMLGNHNTEKWLETMSKQEVGKRMQLASAIKNIKQLGTKPTDYDFKKMMESYDIVNMSESAVDRMLVKTREAMDYARGKQVWYNQQPRTVDLSSLNYESHLKDKQQAARANAEAAYRKPIPRFSVGDTPLPQTPQPSQVPPVQQQRKPRPSQQQIDAMSQQQGVPVFWDDELGRYYVEE